MKRLFAMGFAMAMLLISCSVEKDPVGPDIGAKKQVEVKWDADNQISFDKDVEMNRFETEDGQAVYILGPVVAAKDSAYTCHCRCTGTCTDNPQGGILHCSGSCTGTDGNNVQCTGCEIKKVEVKIRGGIAVITNN